MAFKQEILNYTIVHWQNNFTGISAISVADEFSYPHEDILAVFEELHNEGWGNLRKNVKLFQITVPQDKGVWSDWYGDVQEIETNIFFPAESILTEAFFSGPLARSNLPEYLIRLHKGYSQIGLAHFSLNVLKKYLDHPEIYDIEDTVAGGMLTSNAEYLEILEANNEEIEGIIFIRYGKRLLVNDQVIVSAILHDLSEMPASEQRHWHAHELEEPSFAQNDPDFEKFLKRNFEAEWIDYDDPLEKVIAEISRLNGSTEGNLFTRQQNAYLVYPVTNTYKNFCDSCSELYKLVGPDNINNEFIKNLLVKHFGCVDTEFFHSESGRPLSKIQLLKLLAQNLNSDNRLIDVIEEIKEHRVSADHRIIEPKNASVNYVAEFRRICEDLFSALTMFADDIENL